MKSLFVGNLSFQTTESELNDLFKPFGQVGRVNLVKDRDGGRNLKVNEARPKEATRAPRFENGGGNRGGNRERFSNEDYREAARQPREPRW